MKYDRLDDAGTIHIHYEGPSLDALTLGVLEVQLHRIAEKVAIATLLQDRRGMFALLERPSFLPPGAWRRLRWRWLKSVDRISSYDFFPYYPEDIVEQVADMPIIRLRSDNIRNGSLYQDLSLYVVIALSNSDVRAVLQGFGGNLLYAIVNSGWRGIEWVGEQIRRSPVQQSNEPETAVFDPFDVGSNVRDIVREFIANGNGEASTLTITHKVKSGQQEIKIQLK